MCCGGGILCQNAVVYIPPHIVVQYIILITAVIYCDILKCTVHAHRQHGVSYFNPQVPNWDPRLIPIEQEAKDRCSVLLFVVSGDTLSVASLVEVAYYIGRGRKLVLCLNDIPQSENPVVDGIEVGV